MADGTSRALRWTIAGVLAVTVLAAPSASALRDDPAESRAVAVEFHDGGGLTVLSVDKVDDRRYDVSVQTSALKDPAGIDILLPDGYGDHVSRRYPVLYLYSGSGGGPTDWVTGGKSDQVTAGLPLIVVSPEIMPTISPGRRGASWFANWLHADTALGPNQWETFLVDQLLPWVDSNLRTRANRGGRAVAGLSLGGFGSLGLPARNPDTFVSAASFSGAVDVAFDPDVAEMGHSFVLGTTGQSGVRSDAIFGADEVTWQGHDPTTLVANLAPLDVRLFTGNGEPGPLDSGGGVDQVEPIAETMSKMLYQRSVDLGVPVHLRDYGPGRHTFAYWTRDLKWYLKTLMPIFAEQRRTPRSVSYESVEPTWSEWGWAVQITRKNDQEFSRLTDASARGFRLSGTGVAQVRTRGFFTPGSTKELRVITPAGTKTRQLVADSHGRLVITVPLGKKPAAAPEVGVPQQLPAGSTTRVVISRG